MIINRATLRSLQPVDEEDRKNRFQIFMENLRKLGTYAKTGKDPDLEKRLKREQLLKKNENITGMVNKFNKKFQEYNIKLEPGELVDGVQQYTLNEPPIPTLNDLDKNFQKNLKDATSVKDSKLLNQRSLTSAEINASNQKVTDTASNIQDMSARWDAQRKNSRAYKLNPNKNAGATRWVGVNSTWTNADGSQVYAPQIPLTTENESAIEATHSANTNNINITEAQKQIKLDEQHMKGWNDPRTVQMRLQDPSKIPSHLLNTPIPDFNPTAIKGFDTLSPTQMKQFKNLSSNQARMEGAGKAVASELVNMMIAKLSEPKKGKEGAINLPNTKSPDEDYLTALANMSLYT